MSADEALNPAQFHPNINHYRDGGMGGVGEDHSVVGYVRTAALRAMPGNRTTPEGVERHRASLRAGEGFKDPAMVVFDPKQGRAYVGEGNHRVEAAHAEGHKYVPVRVSRTRFSEYTDEARAQDGGNIARVDHPPTPFRGGMKEPYWPSDMHPSHVFPEHEVWKPT